MFCAFSIAVDLLTADYFERCQLLFLFILWAYMKKKELLDEEPRAKCCTPSVGGEQ